MNWEEELKKKLISYEEAAKLIKSGDFLLIATGYEPAGICYALAGRMDELKGVRIVPGLAGRDFAYYDAGWEDSFLITPLYVMPATAQGMAEKRSDFIVVDMLANTYEDLEEGIDVLLLTVSPPDNNGFCSFGGSVWNKQEQIKAAKLVLAELNPYFIRTYGDNFAHISEIDYFTEHLSMGKEAKTRDVLGRTITGPGEAEKKLAQNLSTLIKDGDTIQIGASGSTEFLPQLGVFDNKNDLGIHTELIPGPLIHMVEKGVVTGARKTIDRGKAVGTAIGGGREEYAFVNQNPAFELRTSYYTNDPRIIAQNDNMVAINSAFAVDLTGQIATDSLGHRQLAGTGGQLAFAIGAQMSKGGRYIVVLPSLGGEHHSRIVASFEPGTIVSIPRTLADYIVTEYGIASLRGKSQRRRAEELIAIAHPDFREELRKEAQKLFWPG